MKKALIPILLIGVCLAISAQDTRGGDLEGIVTQKYALVIGNANYTSWDKLDNPINDAQAMKTALEGLGFSVEYITDGNLERMETAVSNLKRRLSTNNNSYGVFYFAGHGVETSGQNYLIPSNANIPNRNVLRERAMSLQFVLDEMKDANNVLNVIVLDACRNLPLALRGGTRGLIPVQHQHPGSIIVYSTGAGQTADDNSGSTNGLFTGQLLQHIRTPGLEVKELFRRVALSVQQTSNSTQIPAIYNTFHGIAYLGSRPDNDVVLPPPPPPLPAQQQFERDIEAIRVAAPGNYTVTLIGDIVFASTFNFSGMQGKVITLQGDSVMRTIRNMVNSSMFIIPNNCVLILGNNITLNGNNNGRSIVTTNSGRFEMQNGSVLIGCGNYGVLLNGGSFEMFGGTISNNNWSGVWIQNAIFTMSGGTISNNDFNGVNVYSGSFFMNGGRITSNTAKNGGGVNVDTGATFTMNDGTISSNIANAAGSGGGGGGVNVYRGTFLMKGGVISNNRVNNGSGGGVYIWRNSTFIKTGGTINSTNSVSRGYEGIVWYIDRNFYFTSIRRNKTAGTSDNITIRN